MFMLKKSWKKALRASMILSIVLCLLVSCGNYDSEESPISTSSGQQSKPESQNSESTGLLPDTDNPWANLDLSQSEVITCYFVGTLGDDWERIVDMANEKMSEKINTTVEFIHVPYSDFQTKYALFLAGDESIDIIYAAPWCNYSEHMKSGAFHGFDWDFVETYMPLTAEGQAESSWKEVSYNGKIWGVPRNDSYVMGSGLLTTRDVLDKCDTHEDEIKNYEDMNEFLLKIAEVYKGTGVYALNCQSSYPTEGPWYTGPNHMWEIDAGSATWMVWRYDTGKDFDVEDLNWYADTDEYLAYALKMAELNKAGVFPADVMSNENFIDEAFLEGRSAVTFGVPNILSTQKQMEERGKELVYVDCMFDEDTKLRRGNYMGYAACFPSSSKKLERAAVALDCMKFDPEINRLLVGGIEGEHYILDAATNTRELGPRSDAYGWGSWFFLLQHDNDPKLKIPEEMKAIEDRYLENLVPSEVFPLNGFTYDVSKYEPQIAAISALVNEYRFSFGFGIYQDDTEAKYNQFINECRAVGLDDIIADIRQQVHAYINQ